MTPGPTSNVAGNWDYKRKFEEIDRRIKERGTANELLNPEHIQSYIRSSFNEDTIEKVRNRSMYTRSYNRKQLFAEINRKNVQEILGDPDYKVD